ncbi:hypothetical protein AB0469_39120 [Streptomyces sp. NPDC093801]|uniref:hypothetical protein n=1 Tax=Streptomyces sp. NPDC093801 TaxID=3155203 RepID=UPI00344DE8D2
MASAVMGDLKTGYRPDLAASGNDGVRKDNRCSSRRALKAGGPEALFCAVAGILLFAFFWTAAIAAYFVGLPARHTFAAAATALTAVAASYLLRPFAETVIRRKDHG